MGSNLPGSEHAGTDDNDQNGDKNLGMPFNTTFKAMGEVGVAPMNARVDKIREG